jgi:hypothetical protein
VLADYITLTSAELLERVTPLVPNLGTLSEEPCWQRTQDWPLDRLLAPIEDAGDARLLSKAAAMDADLDVLGSPDEVFYRGLMDSLGYSANREPMRALAASLPYPLCLPCPSAARKPSAPHSSRAYSWALPASSPHNVPTSAPSTTSLRPTPTS